MENLLPETLLDIMESIGKRNNYTGFKIYSSGHKTNLVIHFLDSSITANIKSCETENNGQLQLKASNSFSKRSPCNTLRDIQRVKAHKQNSSTSYFISEPKLESTNLKENACDHEDLNLSADQDISKQSEPEPQESDSGYSPILDSSPDNQQADLVSSPDNQQAASNAEHLSVDIDKNTAVSMSDNLDSEKDKMIHDAISGAKGISVKDSKTRHTQTFRSFHDRDNFRFDQSERLYEHHGPIRYGWHRYPPLSDIAAPPRFNRSSHYMYNNNVT